jgi:hypothetical protein
MSFGLGTTATVHFVGKPYVTKLWVDRSGEIITVETLSLFAKPLFRRFLLQEVLEPGYYFHRIVV